MKTFYVLLLSIVAVTLATCSSSLREFNWYKTSLILCMDENCKACHGTAVKECNECHGKGEISCYSCDRNGMQKCLSCRGDGTTKGKVCKNCEGKGKVKCTTCGGDRMKTCNVCDGAGKLTCLKKIFIKENQPTLPDEYWPMKNF